MPNPNAIVSTTIRLDPPLDRPPEEMLRAEGGLSLELEGGRRVTFDPSDPRSAGFAKVLEGLRKLLRPVYLEVDPVTSAVTRLLIPLVARVVRMGLPAAGAIAVDMEPSHARHVLRLDQPDSAELEGKLRRALESGDPVILTEDDAHVVIDVRPITPDMDVPLPPFPVPPEPRPKPRPPWSWEWIRNLLGRILWWLKWPWWWWHCPSMASAQQTFNTLSATSCDPLTVPAPCIPFLYPDDGCWARASEMCRLMINMGLSPAKVWIDAATVLHVNTKNNPACYVEWGWHVAPTLCVRGRVLFRVDQMVIDPSLFTTPVTKITWKSVQGDPSATLTDTDASVYFHGGGTDPTYAQTDADLAYYRLQLQARAIQQGPPPYAACP